MGCGYMRYQMRRYGVQLPFELGTDKQKGVAIEVDSVSSVHTGSGYWLNKRGCGRACGERVYGDSWLGLSLRRTDGG